MLTEIGTMTATVSARNVQKSFGDRMVLCDISLDARPGEIRAVLGNNGSGKSTLIKILTGAYTFDSGEVVYGNRQFHGRVPPESLNDLGVRVIHQESPLAAELTVAEIYGLQNGFPTRLGIIDWKTLRRQTKTMLDAAGASIPTDALISSLDAGERATVALLTALHNAKPKGLTIILDETTASLSSKEARHFLRIVRNLAREAAAVIMITHRLTEVLDFADSVNVMRGGRFAYSTQVQNAEEATLLKELNSDREELRHGGTGGPQIDNRFVAESSNRQLGTPLLTVRNVSGRRLNDASLNLNAGEIVGIPIAVGNGASELLRAIAGADLIESGEFAIDGAAFPRHHTPSMAIARKVALLPGDRLKDGGIPQLDVRDNLAMPRYNSYWFKGAAQKDDEGHVFDALAVSPRDPLLSFGALSGGNQQKVLLGKWLLTRPKVILLDDPTVGVDPASRETILGMLRGLSQAGTAVLMTSTEPAVLARICDRVLMMRDGSVIEEINGDDISYERISLEYNR